MKNFQIKIEAISPSKLDKHRLSKFASYPNRTKHYKAAKSFLEVLLETAKKTYSFHSQNLKNA